MQPNFQLMGHRGARGLFPENTLEGFRSTIAMGVTAIEIDVGTIRDGTVVVHHDIALNPEIARTPGDIWLPGAGPLLKRMDWDELQDYDIGRLRPGSPYAARYPGQAPIDGARIPTLLDTLTLDTTTRWFIELKLQPDRPDWTVSPEEMVERVLSVVQQAGAADRVTIQSFDWRAPRHARIIAPGIARAWLTRAETIADPALWWGLDAPPSPPEAIAEEGGGTWTPYWEEVTQDLIEVAHRLDIAVVPWTVNEVADMQRLARWNVDGLISDYPDRFPSPSTASGRGGG